MTDDLIARIEARFKECRDSHRPIQRLEEDLAKAQQAVKDMWADYNLRANRLRIRAAAIQRKIRVEELYLKQNISYDLRARGGETAIFRKRFRIRTKPITTINPTATTTHEISPTS